LLALRTTPPLFSAAQAEDIARVNYGLAAEARPLPGERDRNFRLRTADGHDYVLKILDFSASAETRDCQLAVLRHVAEQDPALPVPRLVATLEGEEIGKADGPDGACATCLMSFLPGRLLGEGTPGERLLGNLGETLARLDRALQGFFHPALGQRLAWDVRRLPELTEYLPYIESIATRGLVEAAAMRLKERMAELRGLPGQAIHGDCHGSNLLVDVEAGVVSGILDFGDMIHGPRILEPAVAMSELLTEAVVPLGALAILLRGYARRQRLDGAEVEALYDLIAARHAATILVHAWRSRHDAEGASVLERAAEHAARSLESLREVGAEPLTAAWHRAAGTSGSVFAPASGQVDIARRRRLMGAGAELFYEKPLNLVRGSGVWLYDGEDRAYLDAYNNVPHVGHTHPRVVRAIQEQTAILATHTRYLHSRILEYAERLTATLPPHLNACMFVNSGSEANDVAWRIAQFSTGHKGALVMQNAYHGITTAVAALTPSTGQPRDAHVVTIAPPPAGARYENPLRPADLEATVDNADGALRTLAERGFGPAAFFIDTAVTSSGIFDPPPSWGEAVSARIRAAGGLIVADEVQYGLGRCGSHMWGFERRGLQPDIVTLGKPVANGYPMGVVVANRVLIEAFQKEYGFFSTFGGNAVAAAAGLAVLDVLDGEELLANAANTGAYLRRCLENVAAANTCLGAVRGAGLLLGLEVRTVGPLGARQCAKRIINLLAAEERVLIGYEGPNADILKLRPPMPFGAEHADRLAAAISSAAARLDRPQRAV
jgi:4-aminobutyrate aminotransferase-like enzyme/Ser/Thr protein kinase RdoA (MazF antagonist)